METTYAYLAGALDIDGFISIDRRAGRLGMGYRARIGISDTSPVVPKLLHSVFRGRLSEIAPKKSSYAHYYFACASRRLHTALGRRAERDQRHALSEAQFQFHRDIAPVASIDREPQVMVVNPSVPAKTVSEFIAHAKANPGKISMASQGIGGSGHLTGELFQMMAGVKVVHVPYRGAGPALAGLLGGQVEFMFAAAPSTIEYVKTGKLRGLAVIITTRSEALADVPTVAEFLPGFEASSWYGVGAPKATPASTSSTRRSMPASPIPR